MKEYTSSLKRSVFPTPRTIRVAASIEHIAEFVDSSYRTPNVGLRGEELPCIVGTKKPNLQYYQHLRDMCQFHAVKKFVHFTGERFPYTDEQKEGTDPVFSCRDLACTSCVQTTLELPKGEFAEDAMRITNMYTIYFAHPPGKMVTDYMHTRSTYLDGVRDLDDMTKLPQDKIIVALHFEQYFGPVGGEPFEEAPLQHALDPAFEERLRGENWALPANLDKPMAVVMVIQAYRGPPVLFKLSDFARVDPATSKYRLKFPTGVYEFLLKCDVVIVYDQAAMYNLLVDTYGKGDFFPGAVCPLDGVKILDLARLNSVSTIGDKLGT
ncbi:MAG: hypothetical protein GY821_03325, partial [Gammaproteobacteria bacterium]|nr:hypothetical protein [Gammaproteobacteria bacterium]